MEHNGRLYTYLDYDRVYYVTSEFQECVGNLNCNPLMKLGASMGCVCLQGPNPLGALHSYILSGVLVSSHFKISLKGLCTKTSPSFLKINIKLRKLRIHIHTSC